jgi:hypothetical protein
MPSRKKEKRLSSLIHLLAPRNRTPNEQATIEYVLRMRRVLERGYEKPEKAGNG